MLSTGQVFYVNLEVGNTERKKHRPDRNHRKKGLSGNAAVNVSVSLFRGNNLGFKRRPWFVSIATNTKYVKFIRNIIALPILTPGGIESEAIVQKNLPEKTTYVMITHI